MRDFLRGIALGVLLATVILACIHYNESPQVITKEKDYTIDAAKAYLQQQGYEVAEKGSLKPDQPEETQPEEEKADEETEKPTEEKVKEYQLTIKGGMSSRVVSEVLYENGIVDDAKAFNAYLEENDFQSIIQVGTYDLNDKMSYEQIAKAITR